MTSIRFPSIPADTVHASEIAFGKDHPYIKIGDGLKAILADANLAAVASMDAILADSFWLYSLASVLQYWEGLTDRQMANATRTRVDLKYALHLPLIFPGIEPSALCRFRQGLFLNQAGREAFQQIVDHMDALMGGEEKHLSDSELIISTICTISRWEIVMDSMSSAIEALAANYPEWLRTIILPHWYKRYYHRPALQHGSRASKNIETDLLSVGEDGQHLLEAVEKSELSDLMKLAEIRMLRDVWQYQFEKENEKLRLRSTDCSVCSGRFQSL